MKFEMRDVGIMLVDQFDLSYLSIMKPIPQNIANSFFLPIVNRYLNIATI
jgi:hypothetical protein